MVDSGGWEIINLVGRFEKPDCRQVVRATVRGEVCRDLWLRRVVWCVRRQTPLFTTFDPSDRFDIKMRVSEPVSHVIEPDFSPLENLETVFEIIAPFGLVLRPGAKFEALFRNPRVLKACPVDVIVSLHCSRETPDFKKMMEEAGR